MKTAVKIFIVIGYLSMTTYFSFQWLYNQPKKPVLEERAGKVEYRCWNPELEPNWKRKNK